VDRFLYFVGDDGEHGEELWRTDGTPQGTTLFDDIDPAIFNGQPEGSNIGGLVNLNGKLLFTAHTATSGPALWASDGTLAGTAIISPSLVGISDAVLNGRVYFSVPGPNANQERLCITDGTARGTQVVTTFNSQIGVIGVVNNRLILGNVLFGAGSTLYASDGTAAAPVVLGQFNDTWIGNFVNVGDQLLFQYGSAGSPTSHGLWRTDGTVAGTHHFGPAGLSPVYYVGQLDADLYFYLGNSDDAFGLWKLDRTSGDGENLGIVSGNILGLPVGVAVGDTIYFANSDNIHGSELWKSDGAAAGTALAADPFNGPSSSSPQLFGTAGQQLVFTAYSPRFGQELFAYTPSKHRVTVLHDAPGTLDSNPTPVVQNGDALDFTAQKSDGTWSLYRTDGTRKGTMELADNVGGAGSEGVAFGSMVYMILGGRLWQSDGTASGTRQLDGQPTGTSSYPAIGNLFLALDRLYYVSARNAFPQPIYTLMVIDTPGAPARSAGVVGEEIRGPYTINGGIYFTRVNYRPFTPTYYRLTADGVVQVASLPGPVPPPEPLPSPFADSITIGDTRYYAYDDGIHGMELWMDDGKHQKLVADLYEGPLSSLPDELAYVNGYLVLAATTQEYGREMFAIKVKSPPRARAAVQTP
jgi:ELWxxDGT repeat protein